MLPIWGYRPNQSTSKSKIVLIMLVKILPPNSEPLIVVKQRIVPTHPCSKKAAGLLQRNIFRNCLNSRCRWA
jgi:hypothetical protein